MIRCLRTGALATALAGVALCLGTSAATAQVVTGWTFESVTVASTAGTTPSVTAGGSGSNINSDMGTVAGLATALHASASTVYSTPAGNGSPKSLSSNTWTVGDYYQFSTNTTGETGIQILFDATSSATGPSGFKVTYSTDGGSTFNDLPAGTYTNNSAASFSPTTFNGGNPPRELFSPAGAFDNIANLVVRLVDTSTPGGPAGTSRVDNFDFGMNLSSIPEPSSLALLGSVAVGGLYRRFRRKA